MGEPAFNNGATALPEDIEGKPGRRRNCLGGSDSRSQNVYKSLAFTYIIVRAIGPLLQATCDYG